MLKPDDTCASLARESVGASKANEITTAELITLLSKAIKLPEKISPETKFVEDLDLDSLDLVELLMRVEDEYGVEIEELEAEGMKTVEQAVAVINKLKEKS